MPRKTPFLIEEDKALIDCYRFKMQIDSLGRVRIYAFNKREKGDVEIVIDSGKILLFWEYSKGKGVFGRSILETRLKELVLNEVFQKQEEAI